MTTTEFSLQGLGLKLTSAADISDHIDLLKSLDIDTITFSGNTLGIEAGKSLAEALDNQKNLKKIMMSDMFTGRLKTEIPPILTELSNAFKTKSITYFDLSDNALGPAGAEPLVPFLKNNTHLETLYLHNNGLGIGGGKIIALALEGNQNLKTIVMGRNRLESEGAMALAKTFGKIPTLMNLRLPQNSIRPEGIENILLSLLNTPLEVLDLQDNTFTDAGCRGLVTALDSWQNIRILNIGECLLGSKGAIKVLKKLTNGFNHLEELYLSYNEINEEGASLIPDMIRGKTKLKKLELNGNAFDADSDIVEKIREALEENGFPDALDELDDMEVLTDDEDEDQDEEDEEKDEKEVASEDELDELTRGIKSLST